MSSNNQVAKVDDKQGVLLFGRVRVEGQPAWQKALKVERVVKGPEPMLDKKGNPKKNKNGTVKMKPAKDVTNVSILPRVASGDKPSLSTVFVDLTGQQILDVDLQARVETGRLILQDLEAQVLRGEMVFSRGRRNNLNRSLSLSFKESDIRIVGEITEERAMQALGITKEELALVKARNVTPAQPAAQPAQQGQPVKK